MNCFIKRGVVVGCLLLVGLVGAKEWDILTDQRSIRDVVYQDGRFWCATEGGLSVFDPNDGQFDLLTMIDGLAGVGIGLITQDASGGLWLGFDNRMIQRWLPGSGATHTVSSLAGEAGLSAINSIQLDQRGIYVGTNRGISRLLFVAEHDRWVWFEEYRRLGSGIEDQPVRDILLLDSALWAATPLGVAIGNLTAGSPLSSSDWRVHNTNHGLPSVDVRSLARYRGEILAATGGGLAAWNGSSWRRIDIRTDIVRVEVQGDTLWAVGRNGLWYWNGSVLERIGAARPNLSAGLKDSSGEVWISSLRTSGNVGGLSRLVDGAWVDHLPNGPSTNMVWAFAFTPDGDLLLTGGRQGGEYGLSRRTGLTWRNWVGPQLTERIFSAPTRDIALDYDGGIWVGSFFGGIARFAPDGTYATFDHSAETGARLVGYGFSGAEATLVLAPAVETDPLGNVWVVNRGASNGRVLVCIPRDFIQDPRPEKEWVYFHRSQFGNYPHFDLIA
ncbi:MAG: hypothetical protein FJY67_06555, partial [Calditrichaeota bacterium]|nr:hypothetical protein [Calditrichota bacterium]